MSYDSLMSYNNAYVNKWEGTAPIGLVLGGMKYVYTSPTQSFSLIIVVYYQHE